MEKYKNLSGDSGVSAYEIGEDSLIVEFTNGSVYVYDYGSAGRSNIEEMKILARTGRGLSTFISQQVKNKYAKKLI